MHPICPLPRRFCPGARLNLECCLANESLLDELIKIHLHGAGSALYFGEKYRFQYPERRQNANLGKHDNEKGKGTNASQRGRHHDALLLSRSRRSSCVLLCSQAVVGVGRRRVDSSERLQGSDEQKQ